MLYAVTLLALLLAQEPDAPAKPEAPGIEDFFRSPLPLMLLVLGAFFFLVVLPGRRKERQQREQLYNALKKNDEVLTSAGIIGTVANIKDDEVTLKVDESANVRLRVLKSSIVRILSPKTTDVANDAVKAGAPPAQG